MNETNKLSCFSLSCDFACESQEELEKHEKEHKQEYELKICERCNWVNCKCDEKDENDCV